MTPMMSMTPSIEEQKAQLAAADKEIRSNLQVVQMRRGGLQLASNQFANTIDACRVDQSNGQAIMHIAEGLRLYVESDIRSSDSAIAAMEKNLGLIEKALQRLESPIALPILSPPYPGGPGGPGGRR